MSDPVELRETHISWVLLKGDRAYKLKKPLRLPFLDYGSLERRHHLCREEVRLNRRLAPEVYLGVRALVRADGGVQLAPEDAPGAVEYAVEMRRYDEDATLARRLDAGTAGADEVAAVGRRIAAFHAGADRPADPERAVAAFEAMLSENFATLRELHADRPLIDDAERLATAVLAGRRDELLRRARTGLRARRPRGPARRARRARARDRDRRLRRVRPGPAGDRRRPRPRLPRHGPAAARRAARRRARLGLPRGGRRSGRRRAGRLLRRAAGAHPGEGRAGAGRPGRRAPTLRAAGRTPSRCSRSRSGSGGACGSGRQWSSPGRPPAASRRSRRRSASGQGRACCRPISSARSSLGLAPTARAPASAYEPAVNRRTYEALGRRAREADRRRRARGRRRDVPLPGRPRGVPRGARRRRAHVARVPRARRGARTAGRRADAGSRTRLGRRPRRRGPPGRGVAAAGRGPGASRSAPIGPGKTYWRLCATGLDARLAGSSRRTTQ